MIYNTLNKLILANSLFIYLLCSNITTLSAQSTKIINQNLCSLNIHSKKNYNSPAIILLNSNEQININFDYLDTTQDDVSYEIIHCNANWKKSNLSEFDYMEGFSENYINEYEDSFNTNIDYIHYSLDLPNDDVKLTKSGNYKIIVYKNNKRDTLFIAHFSILEPLVNISGNARSATNPKYLKTSHEIDFKINHKNIKIFDPINDFQVFVWQNQDINTLKQLKPAFIRNNELSYDYNQENIFKAGNEYRSFNTQNKKYLGRFIKSKTEIEEYTHITLQANYNRHFKEYIYEKDINGKYVINAENTSNSNTEADYMYIHFTLAMDTPLDKNIYVYGALSNWDTTDKFKMKYNLAIRAYTLSLLLKQGYYNYEYVVKDKNKIDRTFIEGSHYQTENDYYIAVYFRDRSRNYDRLVGYKLLNSKIHQAIEPN